MAVLFCFMYCLTEFRQDAGINSNPKKVAAQGELPEGQERVAWAMYVGKNTALFRYYSGRFSA